ncbi:MAG: transglutaminase domain-containing protein [Thermomicrobiales bacterium]
MQTLQRSAQEILDFYTQPARMTSPGKYAAAFRDLPCDVHALAPIAQGLILHEHIAPAYGQTLSDERRRQVHTRPTEEIVGHLLAQDGLLLTVARSVETRHIGDCRHFSTLTVAMLRDKGVSARARCGFATYFEPDMFVDHWVLEYWNEEEGRWTRVDAQIDKRQCEIFHPDFDLFDVPRNRFLIAGDAWLQCRAGKKDPNKFGIMDMTGL